MTNRKLSRKQLRALHAKKSKQKLAITRSRKVYKVGSLFNPKETAKGNFLSEDHPNPIGSTRPLLGGTESVSENRAISKGKLGVLRNKKLLSRNGDR